MLRLPNGWQVYADSELEARFIYNEIFGEEQTYSQHGIQINDGDVVVDVGANVGMPHLLITHIRGVLQPGVQSSQQTRTFCVEVHSYALASLLALYMTHNLCTFPQMPVPFREQCEVAGAATLHALRNSTAVVCELHL